MLYHEYVVPKVERRRSCGRYDAGISHTATSLRYLEKYIKANEEKSCDISNDDINSLSNASTYSRKHAARAHVSPNIKAKAFYILVFNRGMQFIPPKKIFSFKC